MRSSPALQSIRLPALSQWRALAAAILLGLFVGCGGATPAADPARANPRQGTVEHTPIPAAVKTKRLIVLSDMYGLCVYPVYSTAWTTARIYDFSRGTLEVESRKFEFDANVMLEGPFYPDQVFDGPGRMSSAGYHWLRFGSLDQGRERFVSARGLGIADHRNLLIRYPAGEQQSDLIAMHVADALVPCEARALGPKPEPLGPNGPPPIPY